MQKRRKFVVELPPFSLLLFTFHLESRPLSGEKLVFFFHFGCDELVALTVDVDDLHIGIASEVLTELSDINVHRASVEVVIVDPNLLESVVALQDFVHVCAEQTEKFAFLSGQLLGFTILGEGLLLGIEEERANLVLCAFTVAAFHCTRRKIASMRKVNSSIEKGLVR